MKVFTIEEANRLLPELRQWLQRLQDEHRFLSVVVEGRKAGRDWASDQDHNAALARILAVRARISAFGVLLKPGPQGMCDFPALQDGRLIYLCWQPQDAQVEWWHNLTDGYAGRMPVYDATG